MNQLAQGYMNPTTNKATLSTDNWKKIFETLQQLHQIPNNPYVVPGKVSNTFWVDGRSAMYAAMFVPDATYIMDAKFDWDVVSLPELKDRKGVSSGLLNYYWTMTSISKNRDQAFLAEAFWASEEYQKAQARKGYIPSLKGSSYNDVLGKDIPAYASRSLKSLKTNPAGSYVVNQYQGIADKQLDSAFDAIFANNKDINTVLREAEETANKQIQDAIAKAAK
jgi:multiple sugar transport system substrate-binding protein